MRPKDDGRKMEVYRFVSDSISRNGVCPTTLEIGRGLGMAKSTVSKYMTRLAEEGLIERFGRYQRVIAEPRSCYTGMPVLGRIACGQPILAIEDVEGYLPIDSAALGGGEFFGLIAEGDSMIDAGISHGDTVYVRRQTVADDGDIVVAMVEDEEGDGWRATLKRFYRDTDRRKFILHPENPRHSDIILDRVYIVGVAVRVLKRLK